MPPHVFTLSGLCASCAFLCLLGDVRLFFVRREGYDVKGSPKAPKEYPKKSLKDRQTNGHGVDGVPERVPTLGPAWAGLGWLGWLQSRWTFDPFLC